MNYLIMAALTALINLISVVLNLINTIRVNSKTKDKSDN
jgi:hypothetical protein